MSQNEEFRNRIISSCERLNEFGAVEDGSIYFWIKDRGALSAEALRVIADELDRRNASWTDQIQRNIG